MWLSKLGRDVPLNISYDEAEHLDGANLTENTKQTDVCAAVCVASNAAAVIALLLCNSNFIMLQNTKGPSAKNGRMSLLMDVGRASGGP